METQLYVFGVGGGKNEMLDRLDSFCVRLI